MTSTTQAPFWLLTVFSADDDRGNHAAVVFMDLRCPTDVYKNIADNFNQPITTFLAPLSLEHKDKFAFNIRWFTPNHQELQLCGHGALAAAKIVFESNRLGKGIDVLEFHPLSGGPILTARRREGAFIELCLKPAEEVTVSLEEESRLHSVLARAFSREVAVNHIGRGGEGYENCNILLPMTILILVAHYFGSPDLIVELDEKEDLKGLAIDPNALVRLSLDSGHN